MRNIFVLEKKKMLPQQKKVSFIFFFNLNIATQNVEVTNALYPLRLKILTHLNIKYLF